MTRTLKLAAAGIAGALAMASLGSAGNAQESVAAMVEAADAAAGQAVSMQCIGCHTFGEDEGARFGPGLYGVVDRLIGGVEGFTYSDALAALGAEGETWTVDMLDAFLANPAEAIPGNTMPFPGVRDDTARHNLIAYLATLTSAE